MFLTFDARVPAGRHRGGPAARSTGRGPACRSPAMTLGERRAAAVDHVHPAADRHRRAAPAGAGLPATRPAQFAAGGVRMVRLDAVGYAIKKAGTQLLHDAGDVRVHRRVRRAGARRSGIEVLVEIHAYYQQQIEIAARVDWVYDFALPPLVLHAPSPATPTAAPVAAHPAGERGDRARHPRRHRRDRRRRRRDRAGDARAAAAGGDRRASSRRSTTNSGGRAGRPPARRPRTSTCTR